jgi:hypothetical protein
MGGPGSERDVSLATGRGVAKALRSLGAAVTEVDVRGRTGVDSPVCHFERSGAKRNVVEKSLTVFRWLPLPITRDSSRLRDASAWQATPLPCARNDKGMAPRAIRRIPK